MAENERTDGKVSVGVDLGTCNLRIYVEGRGIVFNEPSIIAIDKASNRVVSIGYEAASLVDKNHDKVEVVRPIIGGVISDIDMIRQILVYTFEKLFASGFKNISKLMLCMPSEITETEKAVLVKLGNELGVENTRIEEEIKASAIGGGVDIFTAYGNMVVDIGGGTTNFGVLSLGDVVLSKSIKIAGDYFDKQIIRHVKEKYKLEIGPQTAEKVKIALASLTGDLPRDDEGGDVLTYKAMGRDVVSGLPRMAIIGAEEIRAILLEAFESIKSTLIATLEITPPELSGDLVENGILLTGGGSLIKGIKEYFEEASTVKVHIAPSPINAVIEGTKKLVKINRDRYFGDY